MTDMTAHELVEKGVWPEPETPLAALQIAEELAEDEDRWISGSWCEIDRLPDEERDKLFSDDRDLIPACTNIKGCAAGLLAIALGDGLALKACVYAPEDDYGTPYSPEFEGDRLERFLLNHPIGKPAAKLLADGLASVAHEDGFDDPFARDSEFGSSTIDSVTHIVNLNDDVLGGKRIDPFASPEELKAFEKAHHARIVRGFAKAVELAGEAA